MLVFSISKANKLLKARAVCVLLPLLRHAVSLNDGNNSPTMLVMRHLTPKTSVI